MQLDQGQRRSDSDDEKQEDFEGGRNQRKRQKNEESFKQRTSMTEEMTEATTNLILAVLSLHTPPRTTTPTAHKPHAHSHEPPPHLQHAQRTSMRPDRTDRHIMPPERQRERLRVRALGRGEREFLKFGQNKIRFWSKGEGFWRSKGESPCDGIYLKGDESSEVVEGTRAKGYFGSKSGGKLKNLPTVLWPSVMPGLEALGNISQLIPHFTVVTLRTLKIAFSDHSEEKRLRRRWWSMKLVTAARSCNVNKQLPIQGIGNWVGGFFRDDDSTSADDEIREVNEEDEIEEILNEPLLEGEYVNNSTLYKGKLFNSDTDAYNFYCLFAKTSGGVAKQRKTIAEVEKQRKRKSSRCNCSAKLMISKRTFGFEEKWMVTCFENSHNHALLDEKAGRDIPINDQARILLLSKAGCSVSLIMRVLEAEKGIETGHLPFFDRDIRNFIISQSSIDKENDASDVLKLCKDLKDNDDAFQYDFTLDESNKLEHIIWVSGDSIRAYEAFGDVVVFDTTYRINRYDMPLGLRVGVNNHGSSIFFGCVLLRDEKIPSFTWALKSFVRFVKGKCPQTILTYQDHALKEAVSTELPNTKHAFCIWHIATKLPTWFSFLLGTKYDDFKTEFYRLYNLECESDFEHQWDLMVGRFDLSNNTYIEALYFHRQFWALAYLKEFFFAGMTTTGRSESINSYIKKFLDANTSLVDFVNQDHNPLMKMSFPIKEHAASILTPYAFELLQHEIELSSKYAATMIDNDSYLLRHHTKLDGGRSNDYFSILEEYIPSRWRRESSLIPQSRYIINYNDNSSVEFRSLVQCLEVESLKTKDRVEVATKELKKVIHCLKGMPEVQENSIDLEHGVLNVDECDVENPITSKTKGRPRGSRAKGGVEAAKKPRHCHYPNCGGTDHDSRNCPIKRKKDSLLASQSSPKK
ncbi:hypothetical protein V8G54_024677 [Vigna mungo]|uniref:Protein FAR1-RELATED SEQUENCE n=1 Tax=Vigna mungo TaxID=3915 RepID=A0AAQ3RTN8_VIGMU